MGTRLRDRRLFTLDEAWAAAGAARHGPRPGAALLRDVLTT